MFVSVGLLAVTACGGSSGTQVASGTSTTAAAVTPSSASPTTVADPGQPSSTQTPPTRAPTTQTPTTRKSKVKGVPVGPSDPDTIVGDAWYLDLTHPTAAKCAAMSAKAVENGGPSGTSFLYLAAAEACLGHWAKAESAFAEWKATSIPASDPCGRPFVVAFVQTLLDRHKADPTFTPEFADAAPAKPCPSTP